MKKYNIILADPAWDFEVWNRDTGNGRSPSAHYKTMSLGEICGLSVPDIADKHCALFIWGVWPRIFDLQPVIRYWGFTYKTLAWEWVKLNRSGIGFHVGMGYYTRANPEPCLLATRGNMPVAVRNERNLIIEYEDSDSTMAGLPMAGLLNKLELPMIAPISRHSQKPEGQYQKIENIYPSGEYPNRIELFARNRYPGFDAWGNEVAGGPDVELTIRPGAVESVDTLQKTLLLAA